MDVSDPAEVTEAGYYGSIYGGISAEGVTVNGDLVYVGAGYSGLWIFRFTTLAQHQVYLPLVRK